MDLFGRGKILLNGCSMLVIDEADRMLDMGFIPDIEEICTKLPATRQTLLFSATMPAPIKKLADRFLSNPKSIEVARPATASTNITQRLVKVESRKKRDVLCRMLEAEDVQSAVIFCNRKTTVRDLNKSLQRHGFRSGEIHGDIDQSTRIAELERFRVGTVNILVASDVAARGLDIKGVSHVFNYDAPWHPDDYVHRIGRTGRAGATGTAYTFVTAEDAEAIDNIQKLIGTKIEVLAGGEAATPAPGEAREEEPRRSDRDRKDRGRGRDRKREDCPREERRPEPRQEPRREEPRAARPEPRREEPRRDDSRRRRDPVDDGPDEGWNGPTPEFLNFGFGG
jgi:superfamily II DNA/RNA helicase